MLCTLHIFTITALFYFVNADYSCSMPGYTTIDNQTCYKVYSTRTDHSFSTAQCLTDGGYLAAVPNGFANSYIQSIAQKAGASDIWLGIQCPNETKSYCLNDDGTPYGLYNNFYPGEPRFGTYIFMNVTNKQWYADHPGDGRPFVCEVKYGTVPTQCPQNYELHENMCYRISNETMTRDDASADCKKVAGGFLATIDTEYLNEWVTVQHTMYSEDVNSFMSIGLLCPNVKTNGKKDSCKWDDGTYFNYSGFYYNYPETAASGGQPCVAFKQGFWYNYKSCGDKIPYICQAPVLKN